MILKMYKICILFDKNNNWLKKYINQTSLKNTKKIKFYFVENLKKFKNFDITFILGFTKIIAPEKLKLNKLNLVVHESNLPNGRGFAPVQAQVLQGLTKIPICLIEAKDSKADSGNIFLKDYFILKKTDLYEDIRKKQADSTLKIIKKFLQKFPNIKSSRQLGKVTFFKKRDQSMSELNINKNIKSQFRLLSICNNDKWPAYFKYKGKKFILKIYKSKQ